MVLPRGQSWNSLVLVIATAIFVACNRDVIGTDASPVSGLDTLAITPQLAKNLTSTGRFVLSGPTAGSEELNENVVRELGRIWIRDYFRWVRSDIEKQHGTGIDPQRLRVCSRIYYADSPYEPADTTYDGGVARRAFGPWWLVPLCIDGKQTALLGVASYATDLRIESGSIRFPTFGGNEFVWRGTPLASADLPSTPESAVQIVANISHSRVAALPRLVLPDFRKGGPLAPRWQLLMEPHPVVSGVSSQKPREAEFLFIGPLSPSRVQNVVQMMADEQPSSETIPIVDWTNPKISKSTILIRKPGAVLAFEEVRKP